MNEKNAFVYALESPNGEPHNGHIVLVSFGEGCQVDIACNEKQAFGMTRQLLQFLAKNEPACFLGLTLEFKMLLDELCGDEDEEEDEEE